MKDKLVKTNKLNPIKPNPRVLTETGFKAKIKKRLHGLGA